MIGTDHSKQNLDKLLLEALVLNGLNYLLTTRKVRVVMGVLPLTLTPIVGGMTWNIMEFSDLMMNLFLPLFLLWHLLAVKLWDLRRYVG